MRRLLPLAAGAAIVASACSSGSGGDRELVVFAAASLTESFRAVGAAFEIEHPGVVVRLNFGPSDGLATQIRAGAPADVFASASERWMDEVAVDPGLEGRATFAANRLVLLVPAANPAGIGSLEDLARPGVRLVLAAEGVPAGDYARESLRLAGIFKAAQANLVSSETDVRGVVQKVLSGDADAGIAYETDVTEAVSPEVRVIEIPPGLNVTALYPIGAVRGGESPALAAAFLRFVMTDEAQTLLARFGFRPAP